MDGWVGGKHACANLTEVSPLMEFGVRAFKVEQTALKVASNKVVKYKKACSYTICI